jgi:hypothetical protein
LIRWVLAADIGVDCERHDFRPLLAFLVETIELADRALRQSGPESADRGRSGETFEDR